MTNSENQKRLDKKKYYASIEAGYDMAGNMDYCKVCQFSVNCSTSKSGYRCDYGGTSADFDLTPYPCSTAYNRMVRKNNLKNIKE